MTDNIKEIFLTLSEYNKITNIEMIKILEGVEAAKLTEKVGSYYGSILGILNHHLLADIRWLRALGNHIPELKFSLSFLKDFPSHRPSQNEFHWNSLNEFKSARLKIDELIERVVKAIPSIQYTRILKIEDRRGKLEKVTWRILLHLFNHHTHHRGSVSVLLDQFNIENDFSNLLFKV